MVPVSFPHRSRNFLRKAGFNEQGDGLTNSPIQILLAEDFVPYRTMVASLLSGSSNFRVICQASDGVEVVEQAQLLGPDVILMDIGLPILNGLEAARRIREMVPAAKILFLTQETDADIVEEAFSFGAAGYISKQRTRSDLLPALTAVLEGKRFISEGLTAGRFAPKNGNRGG